MAAGGCRSTRPVDRQSIGKLAVGLGRLVGRPAAKQKRFLCSVGRLARSTDKTREQGAFSRSTGSVDRQTCTNVHAKDTWPGRPVRSTDQA